MLCDELQKLLLQRVFAASERDTSATRRANGDDDGVDAPVHFA
jgi:hypothetical protein